MIPRLLTSVVLAILIASVLWLWHRGEGMLPWQLLVLLAMTLAAVEWARLIGLQPALRLAYATFALALAGFLLYSGQIGFDAIQALVWTASSIPSSDALELEGLSETMWIAGSAVVLWGVLFLFLAGLQASQNRERLLWGVVGLWLLPVSAYSLLRMPEVFVWIFLGLIALGDTAAYGFGRFFGKTPLAPTISPAKTWAGLIAAAVAGVLAAGGLALWWQPPLVVGLYVLAATLVLMLWGALGDLFLSLLKRRAGVKDSGRLLPGHGGVLDRIDSVLATAPLSLLIVGSLYQMM